MRRLQIALLAIGLSGCWLTDDSHQDDYGDEDYDDPQFRRDAGPDAKFPFIDAGTTVVAPPARLSAVVVADRPPPALSGGTLAVANDGSVAVAADPDRDQVYLIDLKAGDSKTIQLATGSEPGRAVLDEQGRAHVALRGNGKLLTIDTAAGEILAQTDVCTLPRGLAYDATRDAVVIACASGELVTVAAADHASIASAQLELDLRDVVIKKDELLVSRYRSAELLHVSRDGTVLSKGGPKDLQQQRFDPFGGIIDPAILPDGGFPTPSVPTVNLSPTLAWKTVSHGDGVLMLHQQSQDDEISITADADAGMNPLIGLLGGGGGGYGGGCQTITQPSLTLFGADGSPNDSTTIFPRGLAVDVAVSPKGDLVALAEPGSYLRQLETVEVVQMAVVTNSFIEQKFPQDAGFVAPPDGGFGGGSCITGWTYGNDIQATSVAFDGEGNLYAFSREPAQLVRYVASDPQFFTGFTVDKTITLATKSVRDTGHELFHADVGSGLSCAGCHGEALDDGHIWNFKDFGPRRTQTMRGGLLSTLPLHWEGDLGTFKNLVDEVMTRRMGGFQVETRYSDALATWVDKLPALKLGAAESPAPDAVQRGKALFESEEVACASCHSGTHFTNNKSLDVGTGGTFQVPTLNGIALHAPFLHDGCAATLEERFDPSCGGGDKHGHTSQLAQDEIADLVAYLETL
jgi:mono/diheme cytochrome c family protein